MYRILIADPLAEAGLEILRQAGMDLHLLDPAERPRLAELIADFDALVVRSMTQVDADLLAAGQQLKVVGRAGIGVDNVDVVAATERGILVVNAPTANLVSATEHTFALLLALARNIPAAQISMSAGEWNRKQFLGSELNGKTLGVVGLGRIGQGVASRARAFGMTIIAYDPFLDSSAARRLDIELAELDEVIAAADVLTLHTPLTDQTRNLLSRERIARMKPGALLVNCARGGIVDETALLAAVEEGRLGGAALDVFAEEPPTDRGLIDHPRVVTTPHIGAQTREAQERVATETARMLLAALDGSLAVTAVNLPFRSIGGSREPFLVLGEQLGLLSSTLMDGSLLEVQVDLWGVDEEVRVPVTVAAVKGALTPFLGEAVNFVNAEKVAAGRGIEVVRATHHQSGEYPHLVAVTLKGKSGEISVAGTVFGERDPRVVQIEGYRLEFRPKGFLLFLRNLDVPGVVGKVGTRLGEAGVNIAEIHLARQPQGGEAMAVVRVDGPLDPVVVQDLAATPEITQVTMIDLGGVGRGPGPEEQTS